MNKIKLISHIINITKTQDLMLLQEVCEIINVTTNKLLFIRRYNLDVLRSFMVPVLQI